MQVQTPETAVPPSRPSCEGRGLKCNIETNEIKQVGSRPSCEGRGLKFLPCAALYAVLSRPSCEGRGLKS